MEKDKHRDQRVCPHCSSSVSKKTYLAHKRVYYDENSDQWIKKRKLQSTSIDFLPDELDIEEDLCVTPEIRKESPPPPILDFGAEIEPIVDDSPQEEFSADTYQHSCSLLSQGVFQLIAKLSIANPILDEVEVWEDEDVDNDIESFFESDVNVVDTDKASKPHSLVIWLVHFLALIQKRYGLPAVALSALLKFFSVFFGILCQISPLNPTFFTNFPRSVHLMEKFMTSQKNPFIKYVTCPKCYMVYKYEDCIETSGERLPKLCSHKKSTRGQECKSNLLKRIELHNGTKVYYPLKVFCYIPLANYLEKILNRPGICDLCDSWKSNSTHEGIYKDVYDGKVWGKFKVYDGKSFLLDKFTYGLMLNIDWFQPCQHTQYSIGAIYLTVMNLPRNIRFKQENVILVGLISGPSEPKHDINCFLSPLVNELLELWKGVEIMVLNNVVTVRCALLCIACDMPASRKVCGFLGHSAQLGCSKCYKKFPGTIGNRDYSGFDRSLWRMRTVQEHRHNTSCINKCTTLARRNELESKYGCRYSVLLDLPYFDPVTMTIIDPMHNLFLGSAKRLVSVWLDKGYLDSAKIQKRVDSIHVPRFVGRIPHKIASSFSSFTADQFKNWTNIYSLMVLYDMLPPEDMKCWRYFVQASRILCQMQITDDDIKLADAFLLQFCCQVENLYGKSAITPNMHLHCHLKQVLYDYGPVYNFWLFSYERYNGILENFPLSNRSFEIAMMKRFYSEFHLYSSSNCLPQEFQSEFGEIYKSQLDPELVGTAQMTIEGKIADKVLPDRVNDWSIQGECFKDCQLSFPTSFIRSSLCPSSLLELKKCYASLYPHMKEESFEIHSTYRKYFILTYNGVKFSSERNNIVYVTDSSLLLRPVVLNHFLVHNFHHSDTYFQHVFAHVSWLKVHHDKDHFGKPLELWWKDLYEPSLNSFLPIQLIICHSAFYEVTFEEQTVFLMCPVHHISRL